MGSFASVLTQLHATLCLDVHSQDLQGTLDEVEGKSLAWLSPWLAGDSEWVPAPLWALVLFLLVKDGK